MALSKKANIVWRGRLLVVLAAVMWSTSGFFAKAPIFVEWPEESRGVLLALWRALFASLVLPLMIRKIRWSWRLIPMAVIFATMNWTYLNAMVYCEATLAIWLQYTAPVWVFLGSVLLFRERPVARDWLLLALSTAGVGLILLSQTSGATAVGLRFGLASGVCFAGVILMLRWLRDFDSAWLVFLSHAVTAALLAPSVAHHGVYPSSWQWLYLFCFGALQMGLPYLVFALGVRQIAGHEASALTLLEPILVPVWVFVAWHASPAYQFPAWTTIAGAGLILSGLLIRYLGGKERRLQT